jgi:hypothetical protein
VNFEAELKSYRDSKNEGAKEQAGKGKEDEMEMEDTKEPMESQEKQLENHGVADDLFDAYAEEIELDVF